MNDCIQNIECLACGSKNLDNIIDLGMQPLANNFIEQPIEQDRYPLSLNLCLKCYHLQLTHTVNPEIIYKKYLYVSGTSKTLKEYSNWFAGLVDEAIDRQTYNVFDIGCNDGTQLDSFKDLGYNTFGIDPAINIYETSSLKHEVICDYFGKNVVPKITKKFDAITAQNVFAHNPNPLSFLKVCKELMEDHTLLFIQTSQADMIMNNEFDTIYHEHINFFNINSMNELANRAGLHLIEVLKTPIHGNSYVFILSKTIQRGYYIGNMIAMESNLLKITTYEKWKNNVVSNMRDLKNTLTEYKNKGYILIGYGAAAKGNTLLNFANINLDYIIDDNPLKQNLYTPGTSIPVVSIDILKNIKQDDKVLFMPLAWNFFNEIVIKIKNSRNSMSDVYLKYFPKIEIQNV